jgi:cellulose/xylan binding protein with CBM9 domain
LAKSMADPSRFPSRFLDRVLPHLTWFLLFLGISTWLGLAGSRLPSQSLNTRYPLQVIKKTHVPIIDGNLSEWSEARFEKIPLDNRVVSEVLDPATGKRPTQISLARDGSWSGPADLNGWIGLAIDPSALYLFGRILDDRIVPPPSMTPGDWNQGDAIEVFLNTSPTNRALPENEFSDDDYQIFLWPGHQDGPSWGIMRKGGFTGRDHGFVANDGAFEGVKVVFRHFTDRKRGYTFEARFPLLNFPYLNHLQHGYRIGFNLALGDREPGEKNTLKYVYMTWNGKGDLYRSPGNYGDLVIQDPAGRLSHGLQDSASADSGYLLLVLGLLGALILLAFIFTWIVRWIAGWPWPRKLWITGSLGLALAAVLALAPVVRLFSNRFVKDRVAEAAQRTEELVSDCENLIPQSKLLDLLHGQTVDTRKDYDYCYFPVTNKVVQSSLPAPPEAVGATIVNTPTYLGDYTGVEVRRGGRTRFYLLSEELGDALSVVISATRRPGVVPALANPDPKRTVARLYLTRAEGEAGPFASTVLYLNQQRNLARLGPDQQLQPLRGFRPPEAQDRIPDTLYEFKLDTSSIPFSIRSQWFLAVEPRDDAHILKVHGLSARKNDRWQGIPFRINTQIDRPFELVYRQTEPTVSSRHRTSEPIAIGKPLDRLWILFKCVHGHPLGSARDTKVAEVVLRYTDEQEEVISLLSGVHLESHQSARNKLPAHMEVQMGLDDVWDEVDGLQKPTRRDVLTIPLRQNPAVPLQSVVLRWHAECDGPEEIAVTAVTGGVSRETSPVVTSERHPWLTSDDPGSIRLTADALQVLSKFRISTSVIPVVSGLRPGQEGREIVSYVPLDNMNGLRLALELAPEGLIEGARKWAGVVLLIGLLPLVLVLAADGLGRTRRLRLKLFLAIGLVAMPPLALLVVYLDDKIKTEIERATETRARTATEQVVNAVNRNTRDVLAGKATQGNPCASLGRGTPEGARKSIGSHRPEVWMAPPLRRPLGPLRLLRRGRGRGLLPRAKST